MWFSKLVIFSLLLAFSRVFAVTKWYRTDFPNPRNDIYKCGRNGTVSYVCDPQNVLTREEANQIDNLINTVMRDTGCPCARDQCDRTDQRGQGYKIGVAIVEKMIRDADLHGQSNQASIVSSNLDEAMKFAYYQLTEWSLGECEEDIIIFYSVEDQVLYTMTGATTKRSLTNSVVAEISILERVNFNDGKFFKGLTEMINTYRKVMKNEYTRKTSNPEGPRYLAVVAAGTASVLPSLITSVIMALVIAMLH